MPIIFSGPHFVNSLRPCDTYMHQQDKPLLVQIMTCHLTSAKPLSEPMLIDCLLNSWEQVLMVFEQKY